MLATDSPFLVSCSGPHLKIMYEYPPKDAGKFGNPSNAGGGVLGCTMDSALSAPKPNIMNKIPDNNATLPN